MGVIRRHGQFVIRVNPILCDGFGHCAELAPEIIHLDEWGYPVIDPEPIPLADVGALTSARYAERGCPRQALFIERVHEPGAR
jgi:ferredoxin